MTHGVTSALRNADGTANVYITRDPAVNHLTLTLTNDLDGAIVFPPGTAAADDKLPPGQSAIYFYFSGLIANADIAAVNLSASGWSAGTYTGGDGLRYLVIAPAQQVSVPPGGTLSFSLSNVLISGQPASGTADIFLAGVHDLTQDQADVPLLVNIANPPQPGLHTLDLHIGFAEQAIYTGQPRQLTLHLVNPGSDVLVPGGTDSWHGSTPTFQLAFVYGSGPGALTSVADAAQIAMNIAEDYGNLWRPPVRHDQGQAPYWTMQPDPDGGGTVLGTGENAAIEFAITGIDATLPSGMDEALTLAHLSWHSIPGYNDGSTTVLIVKKAGPRITSFTANPPAVPYGESAVRTVLSWDAANASGVRFGAPGVPSGQNFAPSGSGPVEGGITVRGGTGLTLTAVKNIAAAAGPGAVGLPGAAGRLRGGELTATEELTIPAVTRTPVQLEFGSLGAIVLPKASGKAFCLQTWTFEATQWGVTLGAVLDLATLKVTSTFDLRPLIPPGGGTTQVDSAVASPDGKTVHVLTSSGAESETTNYYVFPIDVATATIGKPTRLGRLTPSGHTGNARLLASADGKTLAASAWQMSGPGFIPCVSVIDAASYAIKASWVAPDAVVERLGIGMLAAVSADGGQLLLMGAGGLELIDVASGFSTADVLSTHERLKTFVVQGAVTPDFSHAYCYAIDSDRAPFKASLIAADIDARGGKLTLAGSVPLDGATNDFARPCLSPDNGTVYLALRSGVMWAIDTRTLKAVTYGCGDGFRPQLIASGSRPGVLYCADFRGPASGTVTVLSLV